MKQYSSLVLENTESEQYIICELVCLDINLRLNFLNV